MGDGRFSNAQNFSLSVCNIMMLANVGLSTIRQLFHKLSDNVIFK